MSERVISQWPSLHSDSTMHSFKKLDICEGFVVSVLFGFLTFVNPWSKNMNRDRLTARCHLLLGKTKVYIKEESKI